MVVIKGKNMLRIEKKKKIWLQPGSNRGRRMGFQHNNRCTSELYVQNWI